MPVFAVLLGVLVLGEPLNWHQPVGAPVVLLGVAVAQGVLGRRRPPSVRAPVPAGRPRRNRLPSR